MHFDTKSYLKAISNHTVKHSIINIVIGFNSSYDVKVVNCEEKLGRQDVGTRSGTSSIPC